MVVVTAQTRRSKFPLLTLRPRGGGGGEEGEGDGKQDLVIGRIVGRQRSEVKQLPFFSNSFTRPSRCHESHLKNIAKQAAHGREGTTYCIYRS